MKQIDLTNQAKYVISKIRIVIVAFLVLFIILSPLKVVSDSTDTTNVGDLLSGKNIPSGTDFFRTVERGLYNSYIPGLNENDSIKYNKWATLDDIAHGLKALESISQLTNATPSLVSDFLKGTTVNKIVQTIFSERSNNTDLWWGTFNKTIEAASVLNKLGVLRDRLDQLNRYLNYTLQLADYYGGVNQNTVVVDNVSVPGWTLATLKDLMQYRITSFLSSRPVSFDSNSTNYFDYLNEAIRRKLKITS